MEYVDAKDEMFGIVNAAFAANAAIFTYVPEIRWPGVPKGSKPDVTKAWARTSIQIVKEEQATLSNNQGQKKWTSTGLLFIQLFGSRKEAASDENCRLLGSKVRDAFKANSPSGSVRYYDQKLVELPATDEHYPFNIVVSFEYESVK